MTSKRLWVIAGIVGASAIGVAPAITAAAYPPQNGLGVAGSASGNGTITVTVSNAQDGCQYVVESRGFKEITPKASNKTASTTLKIGSKTGNYQVNVRTFGCSGPTETAHTSVQVATYTVTGPPTATSGKSFKVVAAGWSPDAAVVFALTGGGKTITSKQVTPNEDGDASYTFTAPTTAGTYVVTVVQNGGPSQSYNVTVKSDKVPKVAPKPKPKPAPKPKPKPVPKPKPKPAPKPNKH